ncbi:hypothetical protein BGX30_004483 [Mortierella sp. GBA39]|nr:hypothetical protein BGX30_004483 [Mortierella sp. GBA39]
MATGVHDHRFKQLAQRQRLAFAESDLGTRHVRGIPAGGDGLIPGALPLMDAVQHEQLRHHFGHAGRRE